jgi:hypothetical protein
MPGPYDPNDPNYFENNAMQRNVGLTQPFMPQAPQFMTPGQFSSGLAASFRAPQMQGGMFPNAFATPIPTFTNSSPFLQGPGGVLMPMNPAAMSNPAGGVGNPYAANMGRFSGGSIYQPSAPYQNPAFYGHTGNVHPFSTVGQTQFDTPFQWNASQNMATAETSAGFNSMGHSMTARFAGNAMTGGFAGAAAGFKMGGLSGAMMGGMAGFAGAEIMGAGRFAQNAYMRNFGVRDLNESSYASGINQLSRSFVSGGMDADVSGQGFSYAASRRAARGLDDMSNSSSFRRETFNKFNTADVMRITQAGAENGLMNGVGSPEQMRDRVKSLAKTLSSFMELAQDPDLRSAMQTMGNMQLQGLNHPQTLAAVRNGRAFARMAGTTFQTMAEMGGGLGAQTFQSVGLSQGLGFQSGAANLGMAQNSINRGLIGSQLGNLVGGAQGLGAMNTMASAGFLQSPVLAPAMMNHAGGLNTNALQSLLSGGGNPMQMANMGASNLSGMAGRMGPEGLSMALSMQPLLQDSIGRAMQSSGPFAQRNVEDRSTLRLMTQMGGRGSAGFNHAARLMGMSESGSIARGMEMASPGHFSRQVEAIDTQRLERNAETARDRAAQTPSHFDELTRASGTIAGLRQGWNNAGRSIQNGWDDVWTNPLEYRAGSRSDEQAREGNDYYRTSAYRRARAAAEIHARTRVAPEESFGERTRHDIDIQEAHGKRGFEAVGEALLMRRSPEDRRRELGLISERAGMAQTILNTRQMSQADLSANTNRYFGGSAETRINFAADTARALGMSPEDRARGAVGNALTRGMVGSATVGLMDPGNVLGGRAFDPNAIRNAYVSRMMRDQHMTHAAATQSWTQSSPGILQTASPEARLLMTPEARENAQRTSALAGRGTTDRSMAEEAGDISERGFRGALGSALQDKTTSAGIAQRRLISDTNAQWTGVGNTAEERLRSRGTMTSMATLRAVINGHSSPEQVSRATRQLQSLMLAESRRGADTGAMASQVERYRGNADQQAQQLAMGLSFGNRDGAEIGRSFANEAVSDVEAEGMRKESQGYTRLGRQGGALGRIYMTGDRTATSEEVRERMRGMSPDQIRELTRQSRTQGELAARAARGEDVSNAISSGARDLGTAEDNARKHYRETEAGYFGPVRGLRGISRALGLRESEDEAVDKAVSAGTNADGSAIDQTGDVSATQEAARAAGIGGVNDQLVEAARDLKRAAELFTSAVENGSLDSLTNNINGGV